MNRKSEQAYRGKITSPLDQLFGDTVNDNLSNLVAIKLLRLPAKQPRRYFDLEKMEQLVQSIKTHGILEPLLVRSLPNIEGYELVAGERRYRAAQKAGLTQVPVIVRELDDNQALQLSLVENLLREDLNPVEETEGFLQLLALKLQSTIPEVTSQLYRMANEVKGNVNRNVTVRLENTAIQDIFTELGLMKWESFVRNRLPLLNLPSEILEALRSGSIAYTKASVIASVKNEQLRQMLLEEALKNSLSLEQIRTRIKELKPGADQDSPKVLFKTISSRINQSKTLWEDPKKMKKLTALLKQMQAILDE